MLFVSCTLYYRILGLCTWNDIVASPGQCGLLTRRHCIPWMTTRGQITVGGIHKMSYSCPTGGMLAFQGHLKGCVILIRGGKGRGSFEMYERLRYFCLGYKTLGLFSPQPVVPQSTNAGKFFRATHAPCDALISVIHINTIRQFALVTYTFDVGYAYQRGSSDLIYYWRVI